MATFEVGDTVKIISEEYCTGEVGELVEIDERYAPTGEIYGVFLKSADSTVFFSADELQRF